MYRNKGREYEEKARVYLEKRDIKVIEQNFYGSYGEIDLIAIDKDTLIFIEVKYRQNTRYGMPHEAIDRKKAYKIYLTAKEFIKKNRFENEKIRFDAILFLGEKIQWLKNIFWGDEIGI